MTEPARRLSIYQDRHVELFPVPHFLSLSLPNSMALHSQAGLSRHKSDITALLPLSQRDMHSQGMSSPLGLLDEALGCNTTHGTGFSLLGDPSLSPALLRAPEVLSISP